MQEIGVRLLAKHPEWTLEELTTEGRKIRKLKVSEIENKLYQLINA